MSRSKTYFMVYLSKKRAVVSANDWACIVTACCDICLERMCPLADCNYSVAWGAYIYVRCMTAKAFSRVG